VQAQTTETKRVEMATQAEEDPSCVAAEEADLVRVRLLRNMSPHTLSSLLAVERDAFPECERLGNYMQELSMQRNNGLVIAEDHRPPPGTFPGAFPAPLAEAQGFLLFSRTAEAGVIMKIAVAAAFRGRGVGTALLR
jgi:ribosomal protein S18 acetylase RimI-like enzyme|tara:strand:- start:76 stop:486 length:411 start_codon:yes stop_codon:yes gene_type:complete